MANKREKKSWKVEKGNKKSRKAKKGKQKNWKANKGEKKSWKAQKGKKAQKTKMRMARKKFSPSTLVFLSLDGSMSAGKIKIR